MPTEDELAAAAILSEVTDAPVNEPPRIVIYGDPGMAKTSLAASFPKPIFLQTEDGKPRDVSFKTFGLISSYDELIRRLSGLYWGEHDYATVVLDSITATEKLVFAKTCELGDEKGNKKKNIEDFGYGKGYVYAQRQWQNLMTWLYALRRDRGMAVILTAHSRIERFDDPETTSYDRYEIDLHAKSVGIITREVDAILLLKGTVSVVEEDRGFNKKRPRGEGGDSIFIHATPKPAYVAKNRYNMPARMLFPRGKGYETLKPYLPGGEYFNDPSKVPVEDEEVATETVAETTPEAVDPTAPPPRRSGAPPKRAA